MNGSVTGQTSVIGLLGYPVKHSFSPVMHNSAFAQLELDYIYVPFEVHPDNLKSAVDAIRSLSIRGVNVTIPHKSDVIEHLDWVSESARSIMSVNTIHNDNGILRGYSTDGEGFILSVKESGISLVNTDTVVLGAGGSAKATVLALVENGAHVTVVNRTQSRAIEMAESINSLKNAELVKVAVYGDDAAEAIIAAKLMVNCTSVGMHPEIDASPVPAEWLHAELFIYDQVYNPIETKLIKLSKQAGASGINGQGMLVYQGALAFKIWTGCEAPVDIMKSAMLEGLQSSSN
ncbi:MAG: shikimate dehydrogenase [Armatimonadota bacterium]